jgi:hypothetical protein
MVHGEHPRLVKVYDHLNALVLAEVATTASYMNQQLERLIVCTEAIWRELHRPMRNASLI